MYSAYGAGKESLKQSRGSPPLILSLGNGLRPVVNFMTRPLYAWKINPSTYRVRDSVDLRTALDVLEEVTNVCPCLESKSVSSKPQASHYPDSDQCNFKDIRIACELLQL